MLKDVDSKGLFPVQDNERGSILIVVLLMLVLLTILGFSLSSSSSVEVRIAGNERVHDVAFYNAESGWQVALSWLDAADAVVDNHGSDGGGGDLFTTAKAANPDTLTGGYQVRIAFDRAITIKGGGYGTDSKQYLYTIDSIGTEPGNSRSHIRVQAGKFVKLQNGGY